jgi:hypothetical protein
VAFIRRRVRSPADFTFTLREAYRVPGLPRHVPRQRILANLGPCPTRSGSGS